MSGNNRFMFLDRDTIEILVNNDLTLRQYLVRFKNDYGEMYEMRCAGEELKWLAEFITKSVEE